MISLSYVVEERNRANQIRSRLITSSYSMALSDWLMKSHRPIGFPPDATFSSGDLKLDIINSCIPDSSLFIDINACFSYKGVPVRLMSISTAVESPDKSVKEGYCSQSAGIYLRSEYRGAVEKLMNKLNGFSDGNIDAAYLTALFASVDIEHIFWKKKLAQTKYEYG